MQRWEKVGSVQLVHRGQFSAPAGQSYLGDTSSLHYWSSKASAGPLVLESGAVQIAGEPHEPLPPSWAEPCPTTVTLSAECHAASDGGFHYFVAMLGTPGMGVQSSSV